jgi:hypothetical protein
LDLQGRIDELELWTVGRGAAEACIDAAGTFDAGLGTCTP